MKSKKINLLPLVINQVLVSQLFKLVSILFILLKEGLFKNYPKDDSGLINIYERIMLAQIIALGVYIIYFCLVFISQRKYYKWFILIFVLLITLVTYKYFDIRILLFFIDDSRLRISISIIVCIIGMLLTLRRKDRNATVQTKQ